MVFTINTISPFLAVLYAESLKPSVLPRIKIRESETFLTLAYYRRHYFDQFEVKSNNQDLCYHFECHFVG